MHGFAVSAAHRIFIDFLLSEQAPCVLVIQIQIHAVWNVTTVGRCMEYKHKMVFEHQNEG